MVLSRLGFTNLKFHNINKLRYEHWHLWCCCSWEDYFKKDKSYIYLWKSPFLECLSNLILYMMVSIKFWLIWPSGSNKEVTYVKILIIFAIWFVLNYKYSILLTYESLCQIYNHSLWTQLSLYSHTRKLNSLKKKISKVTIWYNCTKQDMARNDKKGIFAETICKHLYTYIHVYVNIYINSL